jgi:hypothetical protein
MIDPVAVAEATQDALDRLGELTACAEFDDGWSCTYPAAPDGSAIRRSGRPRPRGVDAAVAMRRRPLVRPRNAGTGPERVTHDEADPDQATEATGGRRYDPLPLDPRDPDILWAKQLTYFGRPHHERGSRA